MHMSIFVFERLSNVRWQKRREKERRFPGIFFAVYCFRAPENNSQTIFSQFPIQRGFFFFRNSTRDHKMALKELRKSKLNREHFAANERATNVSQNVFSPSWVKQHLRKKPRVYQARGVIPFFHGKQLLNLALSNFLPPPVFNNRQKCSFGLRHCLKLLSFRENVEKSLGNALFAPDRRKYFPNQESDNPRNSISGGGWEIVFDFFSPDDVKDFQLFSV